MYYVYILQCQDGTLYTGVAKNVASRIAQHRKGLGSKYVRARKVERVVYTKAFATMSDALRRESEIKKMDRPQKLVLIRSLPL